MKARSVQHLWRHRLAPTGHRHAVLIATDTVPHETVMTSIERFGNDVIPEPNRTKPLGDGPDGSWWPRAPRRAGPFSPRVRFRKV